MIKNKQFEFKDGRITFFVRATIDIVPLAMAMCVADARSTKKRKPYQFREVPTLTNQYKK